MKRIVFILMLLIPAAGYSQGVYNYIKTNEITSRTSDSIKVKKPLQYDSTVDSGQFNRNTLVPLGWVIDRLAAVGISFPLSLDNGYFQLTQEEGSSFFHWSKAGTRMGSNSEDMFTVDGTGINAYYPIKLNGDTGNTDGYSAVSKAMMKREIAAAVSGAVVTETDPVFIGSVAYGISASDVSAWDALVSFPGFGTTNTTASRGDHNHTGVYQPVGSYLTANQTITLSGDVSGSGTTAITATLPNISTPGTYKSVTINAKGQVTAGTNPTTISGYGITDAQPIDGDLTSIAAISSFGTLERTSTNTWRVYSMRDTLTNYTFLRHPDVPKSYSGAANKVVSVNSTATGLQFSNVVTTNNVDTAELFWVYKNLNCKNLQSVQLSYSTNFKTFLPYQIKIAITSYDATSGTIDPIITIGNNATDYNNVLASYTLSSPAAGKIYTFDLSQLINNLDSAPVFIKVGTASNKTTFTVAVIINGIYL